MEALEQVEPEALACHIDTEFARDKVAKALYEVILDSLDYEPRDLRSSADREWMRGAIALPIQEATDVALHVLGWRFNQALERAPDIAMRRFEASRHTEEPDLE